MKLETHTLVSEEHVGRCTVMLRSLSTHCTVQPVLHDDGSLSARSVERLREEWPNALIISRPEANHRAAEQLVGHPKVLWWRNHNIRATQLIDYFLFAEQSRVLAVDTDVVFLRKPTEILSWVSTPENRSSYFAYSPEFDPDPSGIHWLPEAVPGAPFIPAMCCGFAAVQTDAFLDLDYLEDLIDRTDPVIRVQQRFVTQMYYSLLAGRLPAQRVVSLGEQYRSGPLEDLPSCEDRAICHYFGSRPAELGDGLEGVWSCYPHLRAMLTA
ncbi:hypothetical protein [Nonomuraea sp. NPDC049400]|uniref:hypothetical protein n=1 Tax=Nonomuraea sp. NPDC049400 TaxID=3364352 RepID=UPI0037A8474C